ncbi:hypothetical protein DFH08DRAFT_975697 [Mycena albidolilacea]|uniref:Zn(2)-C6 fungal-type domain-containing protein n=1 Tax=Mycena albidolilacea TaxID=1033008 RepID=A0AAD6Z540_9AGAR|nr:hypothetical protein DFH08DRAFT_975697 [Mycena albidolilacea]
MAASTSGGVFVLRKKRTTVACKNCRRRKIKAGKHYFPGIICITSSDQHPCARCSKNGFNCQYISVSEDVSGMDTRSSSSPPPSPTDPVPSPINPLLPAEPTAEDVNLESAAMSHPSLNSRLPPPRVHRDLGVSPGPESRPWIAPYPAALRDSVHHSSDGVRWQHTDARPDPNLHPVHVNARPAPTIPTYAPARPSPREDRLGYAHPWNPAYVRYTEALSVYAPPATHIRSAPPAAASQGLLESVRAGGDGVNDSEVIRLRGHHLPPSQPAANF